MRSTGRVFLLTLLVVACSAVRTKPDEGNYRFVLDGVEVFPSLTCLQPEHMQYCCGDVVTIGEHTIVLGPPGLYEFEREGVSRLFRLRSGRSSSLVALTISRHASKRLARELLLEDWRSLRGISIDAASRALTIDALRERLRDVDGKSCYIALSGATVGVALAAVSIESEYLDLARCTQGGALDETVLERVRFLRMPAGSESAPLDVISAMPNLEYLDISFTGTEDFRPLGGHSSLRILRASCCPVKVLPQRQIPNLRRIELLMSGISESELGQVEQLSEDLTVLASLQDALVERCRTAARLMIWDEAVPAIGKERALVYSTGDRDEIADFLELLEFEEDYSDRRAFGSPNVYVIELSEAPGRILAALGLAGPGAGTRFVETGGGMKSFGVLGAITCVRCPRVFPTVARLSNPEAVDMQHWLKTRGVRPPGGSN